MKFLIAGATGLIGRELTRKLQLDGHEVRILTRNKSSVLNLPEENVYQWSADKLVPTAALDNIDVVINLAGEGIADKRWTHARKIKLRSSRLDSTKNLISSIERLDLAKRPKCFISASAVGFYGNTGDRLINESSPSGYDFLAQLTKDWEEAALNGQNLGLRVVVPRIGIVLAKNGGALSKMAPVTIGNGQQWMSWIHIEDVVGFIIFAAINTQLSGIYNLTSPEPVTNKNFTKWLSRSRGIPLILFTPPIILKLVLGELACVLTGGQRVIPTQTIAAGFNFKFSELSLALSNLCEKDYFLNSHYFVDQFVKLPLNEVFPFFSKAENLEILTPPWLNFKIVNKSTDLISVGTLITYKLKIHGVPVHWKTLIKEWQPPEMFSDDQLSGPYSKWYHIHRFNSVEGGTLLRDEITFRVPGFIFGKLLLSWWIKRDINKIFSYRQNMIKKLSDQGRLT